MKRYLIFSMSFYDCGGGWNDFHSDTDSLEKAKQILTDIPDWDGDSGHVVDITTKEVVYRKLPKFLRD